ncbi:hypothetical protein NPIL_477511 [Nephila pilipes]|uniref:Uncharacterized protein n=1 Tax=Nephila pilipes TaxID=299642 RepID=A0A8X6PXF1_NEPPI|nr:hypothetical protein NPIL_477511 [Nephila pilipes]
MFTITNILRKVFYVCVDSPTPPPFPIIDLRAHFFPSYFCEHGRDEREKAILRKKIAEKIRPFSWVAFYCRRRKPLRSSIIEDLTFDSAEDGHGNPFVIHPPSSRLGGSVSPVLS